MYLFKRHFAYNGLMRALKDGVQAQLILWPAAPGTWMATNT